MASITDRLLAGNLQIFNARRKSKEQYFSFNGNIVFSLMTKPPPFQRARIYFAAS
jgi:hypothetical protein